MVSNSKPFKPDRHPAVAPYLLVADTAPVMAFLEQVLGAVDAGRRAEAQGRVVHAEFHVADGVVMLGQRPNAMPGSVHVYVPNVDETYAKAMAFGAEPVVAPRDLPYGERSAGVRDSAGNWWWLGTRL